LALILRGMGKIYFSFGGGFESLCLHHKQPEIICEFPAFLFLQYHWNTTVF
jgi:hypothetical protein